MQKSFRSFTIPLGGVLSSGGLWAFFIEIQYAVFDFAKQTTGIGLIFIPAGVRLGLILIFGRWGALGVALANMFVFGDEFNAKSFFEVGLISAIAGFAPLLAVYISFRLLRISRTLAELEPYHLPIISLIAALVSAIAHNVAFVALGYQTSENWLTNIIMMVFGDFLGCFIVLLVMWCTIKLIRLSTTKN